MRQTKKLHPSAVKPVSAAARIADALDADVHYAKSIELGIANLSAIATQLAEKTGCPPQAAKIAVARWARGRKAVGVAVAERTRRILSRSTLYLQNDVAVLVLENNPPTHRAVFSLQDERILSIVVSARSITLIGPPERITPRRSGPAISVAAVPGAWTKPKAPNSRSRRVIRRVYWLP